jgi:site-specific DNA-methyltransferase (adenine-specific)
MNINTTTAKSTTETAIGYIPGYVQPFFSFYNADNMAIMKTFKDKEFDLAIVDPPYGIGEANEKRMRSRGKSQNKYKGGDWDKSSPEKDYFNELIRISKNQIVWGANHFISKLPYDSSCWIFWDKDGYGDFADGELAWTSFKTAVRKFKWTWNGFRKQQPENRIHPTQKPVALYEWLLNNYANENDKIIDTHLGSGSIAIAIDKANTLDKKNLTFVGIELDPDYFRAAVERFKNHKRQCVLF